MLAPVLIKRRRFSHKTRELTGIDLGLETLPHVVDTVAQCHRLLSVLVEFVFVGNEVGQVELALGHSYEFAHVGPEFLPESAKVNVTIAVGVKHVLHQQSDVRLRSLNLVLYEVRLEVFVGDKSISIGVELLENLVSAGLSRTKGHVLDLREEATQATSSNLVRYVSTLGISPIKIFVDELRGRVCAYTARQGQSKLVRIFFEDKRGDRANVCGAVLAVLEGG